MSPRSGCCGMWGDIPADKKNPAARFTLNRTAGLGGLHVRGLSRSGGYSHILCIMENLAWAMLILTCSLSRAMILAISW